MLARLEEVPGVAESRVDWSGRRFLLELEAGAPTGAVVRKADLVLGLDSRRLSRGDELRAVESYRQGETWMRAGETLELSRTEARALSRQYVEEAAGRLGLGGEQGRRLASLLEEELAAAFARIHASEEGLDERLEPEFERAMENVLARSRAFLSEEQVSRLREHLRSLTR